MLSLGLYVCCTQGEQLRELQQLFRRLMQGDIRVEQSIETTMLYGTNEVVTEEEWMRSLPHCFVWIDFFSIPQPRVDASNGAEHRSNHSSDHRHDSTMSAKLLGLAVQSIPAYVRCDAHAFI